MPQICLLGLLREPPTSKVTFRRLKGEEEHPSFDLCKTFKNIAIRELNEFAALLYLLEEASLLELKIHLLQSIFFIHSWLCQILNFILRRM